MNGVIDTIGKIVRGWMKLIAVVFNRLTRGQVSPNTVTLIGVFAHILIAFLIADGRYIQSGILLIIFGLFDALDGALARLQKKESSLGMLLDASTDRMKEVLIYTGIAYNFIVKEVPYLAVWAVAACGGSLLVSYVKAKGETAIASSGLSSAKVNKVFNDGLLRFEVRMAILVAGLLANRLSLALIVIAVGAWLTAIDRLIKIGGKLKK